MTLDDIREINRLLETRDGIKAEMQTISIYPLSANGLRLKYVTTDQVMACLQDALLLAEQSLANFGVELHGSTKKNDADVKADEEWENLK